MKKLCCVLAALMLLAGCLSAQAVDGFAAFDVERAGTVAGTALEIMEDAQSRAALTVALGSDLSAALSGDALGFSPAFLEQSWVGRSQDTLILCLKGAVEDAIITYVPDMQSAAYMLVEGFSIDMLPEILPEVSIDEYYENDLNIMFLMMGSFGPIE